MRTISECKSLVAVSPAGKRSNHVAGFVLRVILAVYFLTIDGLLVCDSILNKVSTSLPNPSLSLGRSKVATF